MQHESLYSPTQSTNTQAKRFPFSGCKFTPTENACLIKTSSGSVSSLIQWATRWLKVQLAEVGKTERWGERCPDAQRQAGGSCYHSATWALQEKEKVWPEPRRAEAIAEGPLAWQDLQVWTDTATSPNTDHNGEEVLHSHSLPFSIKLNWRPHL
jgi:hypothetical protein